MTLLRKTLPLLATCATGLAGCTDDLETPEYACVREVDVDPLGDDSHWVVDQVTLATTPNAAMQLGMNVDCDPDSRPDNMLGEGLASVYNLESTDLNQEIAAMIDGGQLLHLLTIRTRSLENAGGVGFTLRHAVDLDGDPSDNFSGAERFAIDADLGRGAVSGSIGNGRLTAQGDQLPLGLGLPSLDEVVVLPIAGVHVDATIQPDSLQGRVGGGIPREAIDGILIPFIHRALAHAVDRDCPDGSCLAGTFGEILLQVFDTDGDGELELTELRGHELIASMVRPDLDLFDADGNLDPGIDGIDDSLSVGIGFTAVPAQIVE